MTSKEKLDYMYGVAICGSGLGETADKVRECYNKIADDLEVLEILIEWCLNDFIEYNYNDYDWVEFPLTIYDMDTEEEVNKKRIVIDYLKKCK